MRALATIRPACLILALPFFSLTSWDSLQAQTDPRFGTVGREGAERLNLTWYREYQRQNNDPIPAGKQKHFVVGQFTNRSDALGIDWDWYLLDLLEQPNSLLLQHFLNLVLDLIHNEAVPVVRDAWRENRDDLELLWEQTVNKASKTWEKRVWGRRIYSYTVRLSDTQVTLPEELPEIQLTVGPDGESIILTVTLDVVWSTHARGTGGSIHASPTFNTKLTLYGLIGFDEDENGRYLTVKEVRGESVTDAQGDIKFTVNILNIGKVSFTWRKADVLIQTEIDKAIEGGIGEIMKVDQNQDGKPDIAEHFYFEQFISDTFFDGQPVPRQQEIIDRIFADESEWIREQIVEQKQVGAYWEVGNEPNWFPLMRPEQYAALYTNYYHLIKSLDPTAQCLVGGLFLKEALDNPSEIVSLLIPDLFGFFREELTKFITGGLFETSTVAWFEAFAAALPEDVNVDVGNFHLYPMKSAVPGFQLGEVAPHIEALAGSFTGHGIAEIWLTEFGNIDWRRSQQDVASLCWQLSNYLKSNTAGITRWYWSRSVGYDRRFDAIGQKPITALLATDGRTLTSIGRIYMIASRASSTGKEADSEVASLLQSAESQTPPLPTTLTLSPNYPNPFSVAGGLGAKAATTRIPYALPEESEVRLQIYDMLGRLAREVFRARQKAGWYEVEWDGRNELGRPVTSGIYFVVLQAGENKQTRKMVVTR
jgi:hypothetical protein